MLPGQQISASNETANAFLGTRIRPAWAHAPPDPRTARHQTRRDSGQAANINHLSPSTASSTTPPAPAHSSTLTARPAHLENDGEMHVTWDRYQRTFAPDSSAPQSQSHPGPKLPQALPGNALGLGISSASQAPTVSVSEMNSASGLLKTSGMYQHQPRLSAALPSPTPTDDSSSQVRDSSGSPNLASSSSSIPSVLGSTTVNLGQPTPPAHIQQVSGVSVGASVTRPNSQNAHVNSTTIQTRPPAVPQPHEAVFRPSELTGVAPIQQATVEQSAQAGQMNRSGFPAQTQDHGTIPHQSQAPTDATLGHNRLISNWERTLHQYMQYSQNIIVATGDNPTWQRLYHLKRALQANDELYLILHQLFCGWLSNRNAAYQSLRLAPQTVDMAFEFIMTFLGTTSGIPTHHLAWLATFPLPQLWSGHTQTLNRDTITRIEYFLQQMAQNWPRLAAAIVSRCYPIRAREIAAMLPREAPALEPLIFTATTRILNVQPGTVNDHLMKLFTEDCGQRRQLEKPTTDLDPDDNIRRRYITLVRQDREISRPQSTQQAASSSRHGQNPTPNLSLSTAGATWNPNLQASHPPPRLQTTTAPLQLSPTHPYTTGMFLPYEPSTRAATRAPIVGGPYPAGVSPHVPRPVPSPQQCNPSMNDQRWEADFALRENSRPQSFSKNQATTRTETSTPVPVTQSAFAVRRHSSQTAFHQSQNNMGMPQAMASNMSTPTFSYSNPQHPGQFAPGQAVPYINPSAPQMFLWTPTGQQGASHPTHQPDTSQNATAGLPNQHASPRGEMRSFSTDGAAPGRSSISGHRRDSRGPQDVQRVATPNHTVQLQQGFNGHRGTPTTVPPSVAGQVPSHRSAQSPYEPESLFMGLHQLGARSPRRVPSRQTRPQAPHFQAVKEFALGPMLLGHGMRYEEHTFELPPDIWGKLSKMSRPPQEDLEVATYFDGCLRYRFRICELERVQVSSPEWAVIPTAWPEHIFATINDQPLTIRRKSHNGQAQPAELTSMLQAGPNTLKFSITSRNPPRKGVSYFVAIEIIETLSYDSVLDMVRTQGTLSAETTRDIIHNRLQPKTAGGDAELLVVDSSLSINLADPFTATPFNIPVRGADCAHLECFDLENWLQTRTGKPLCCHLKGRLCKPCSRLAVMGPEPCLTDRWKCPLCDKDARPYSLRIDSYLLQVRESLIQGGKPKCKSILVQADGTWTPKTEEEEEEAEGTDEEDDEPIGPAPKRARLQGNSLESRRQPEVIVLD